MEITIKELSELVQSQIQSQQKQDSELIQGTAALLEQTYPFEVGKAYFIRTVTYHLIGKVEKIVGGFLVLSGASWVADSGRFMNALLTGELNEVEPCGTAFVNIASITDAFIWIHTLPNKQK